MTTTGFSILAAEMLQAQDVDLIVIKALIEMCIRIGGVKGGTGKRIIVDQLKTRPRNPWHVGPIKVGLDPDP